MARDYARIMTTIWRNEEFRALDEAAQRAFLLLATQPDISAAGVLALRLRRWADMASDSTVDSLVQVLKVLDAGRFTVTDWDAEELLIRSFIRWDGGFNNPRRRPAIRAAKDDVTSQTIIQQLEVEFQRCGITLPPAGPPDGTDSLSDSQYAAETQMPPVDLGVNPFPQVNSLSGRQPDSHIGSHDDSAAGHPAPTSPDRVMKSGCRRSIAYPVGNPIARGNTTTHNPQPKNPTNATRSHGRSSIAVPQHDPDPPPEPTAQTLLGEWIEGCRRRPPRNVIGQTGKLIKAMLDEGINPDDIRGGIALWAPKGLAPSTLPATVNEYMNSRPSPRNNGRSPTEDNIRELLAGSTDSNVIALPGGNQWPA